MLIRNIRQGANIRQTGGSREPVLAGEFAQGYCGAYRQAEGALRLGDAAEGDQREDKAQDKRFFHSIYFPGELQKTTPALLIYFAEL